MGGALYPERSSTINRLNWKTVICTGWTQRVLGVVSGVWGEPGRLDTERYGKPNRLIPLWPELQPYLERLFEEAPDGSLRIIQRYQPGQNMHTTFKKIVERAGLKTWPRLIHNLRGSRQEEIEEEFGIVCATEWIGNTEAVAKDHYLRVREADFERALNSGEQIGSKQDAAKECNASPNKNSENLNANFPGISSLYNSLQNQEVGRAGLEPATKGL